LLTVAILHLTVTIGNEAQLYTEEEAAAMRVTYCPKFAMSDFDE
jgi:hypothetical protein